MVEGYAHFFSRLIVDHVPGLLGDPNHVPKKSKQPLEFDENQLSKYISNRHDTIILESDYGNVTFARELKLKGDPVKANVDYCLLGDGDLIATCEVKGPITRKDFFLNPDNTYTNACQRFVWDCRKQRQRAETFPHAHHFVALILARGEQELLRCNFNQRIYVTEREVPGAILKESHRRHVDLGVRGPLTVSVIEVLSDFDEWHGRHMVKRLTSLAHIGIGQESKC